MEGPGIVRTVVVVITVVGWPPQRAGRRHGPYQSIHVRVRAYTPRAPSPHEDGARVPIDSYRDYFVRMKNTLVAYPGRRLPWVSENTSMRVDLPRRSIHPVT